MLTFEISNQFNLKIIKQLYKNEIDLKLAYPSASYPIDVDEWTKWISKKESSNFSLIWFKEDRSISHVAIKSYNDDPGLVYLCFFLLILIIEE